MEDSSLRKRVGASLVLAAMFVLFQTSPRAQETGAGAGKDDPQDRTSLQDRTAGEDVGTLKLVRQLTQLRKSGDLEGAARIFAELFPSEPGGDPASASKTGAILPAGSFAGTSTAAKLVVTAQGSYPVFATSERDKNPSADVRVSPEEGRAFYSAAEQWAGDRPAYIRVRKSTDKGQTWPESLILGDGRAVSDPSLRLVSADTIGVAYVRAWDSQDSDIFFARIDAAMGSAAETPVDLGLAAQSAPSLASDREAYASPYLYIVYAEREGSNGRIKFSVSQDLGATWSRAVPIASFPWPLASSVETSLAYDPDAGMLHVAYTRTLGSTTGIAVMSSRNFGVSWSPRVDLTTAADGTASGPAVAARGGTVIVAYEHQVAGQGPDVATAFSTDSGTSWTRRGTLAASAEAERSPDVRSVAGLNAASFFSSYVEADGRIILQRAEASAPGSWTKELTYPEGAGLPALGSAIVLPMPVPGGDGSAGVIWTDTSADDDIYFSASARILAPGPITVTPPDALVSSGLQGGPFTPSSIVYTVTNTGDEAISYHFTKTQSWTTVDPPAVGTLAAFAVMTCTVSINEAANIAGPGNYNDTVTFANLTNGTGNTTRQVTLNVQAQPGVLSVTPIDNLVSTGVVGGPFTPSSQNYLLQNTGGSSINWTCTKIQAWTTLSAASGTLAGGGALIFTVTINPTANTLAAGAYADTLTFTNTTNGTGNTTRTVALTVTNPGILTVTPATGITSTGPVGGPFVPSSQIYTLTNTGGTAINWTCSNIQPWTTPSALSGTLAAAATTTVTVTINTSANSLAAGSYSDLVSFTNTTNGTGNTTRAIVLTVTTPGALTVAPATGLTSTGPVGGPFTPTSQTYTLQNTGGTNINWTATKVAAWTTLSTPASGTLAPWATATVTISLNTGANALAAGAYTDTVTFTNVTTGSGNTTRAVALTVTTPGVLAVAPATGLTSTGPVGGPFAPTTQTYTLTNTGGTAINWTAAKTQAWTTLYLASGTLAPTASVTVDIAINTAANALAAGAYTDTLTFTNTTNGTGNTTRAVALTVTTLGVLAVSPAGGLTSSGVAGGPFTPSSIVYTLQNTGGTALTWYCGNGQAWTQVSAASGTLAAGATTTVTVSLSAGANTLTPGTYTGTTTFTNATTGNGNTTRPVTLTVISPGALMVSPTTGLTAAGPVGGPFTPSSLTFTLTNTGGAAMNWTATKVAAWTTLSSPASGTLAAGATATVTISFNTATNGLAAGSYADTVTFTNTTNGSGNTTRPVALTVSTQGILSVTPTTGLTSVGPIGGPFAPTTQTYTLTNTGGTAINWTAAKTQAWTTLYTTSGTLAPAATVTVDIMINNTANSLAVGAYTDTLTFTNTSNGNGNTTRAVALTVATAGVLAVTPASGFTSSGITGGPFTPSSQAYTMRNTGGSPINWVCANGQAWTQVSATSGTLAAGATATVTVSLSTGANTLTAGTYTGTTTFTNLTNGNGNTSRSVTLTVTNPGVLAITPTEGLSSAGPAGGPFTPSSQTYTLTNTGGTAISWTAARLRTWTTLSATSGGLAPGATATVTVSLNTGANSLTNGSYTDTVTFTNTTNGNGNTTRAVSLLVTSQGILTVTPTAGLASVGPVGGVFTPSIQTYTLTNTGGTPINWTAAKTQAWTTLYTTSGTLASAATVTVDILINSTANSLAAGTYADTLTFTNTSNGNGNTNRAITLNVTTEGVLAVTPATGLVSSGMTGGPFTPSSQAYQLRNAGGSAMNWVCTNGQAWTQVSNTSGTLAAGATTTVTVSLAPGADTLSAGTYTGTTAFTNTTNGNGNTSRSVTLTVNQRPDLSVDPTSHLADFTGGTATFAVANAGGGTLTWTAAVVAGGSWLTIASGSSGTGPGTITVAVAENTTTSQRTGTIRVTASGATNSPQNLTITQATSSIFMTMTAQRLVERAWVVQREYGKLTVTVSNPGSVPIASYVITRSAAGGSPASVGTVAGTSVTSPWVYNDAFLETGTSYTYRVLALDAEGRVIGASNIITI